MKLFTCFLATACALTFLTNCTPVGGKGGNADSADIAGFWKADTIAGKPAGDLQLPISLIKFNRENTYEEFFQDAGLKEKTLNGKNIQVPFSIVRPFQRTGSKIVLQQGKDGETFLELDIQSVNSNSLTATVVSSGTPNRFPITFKKLSQEVYEKTISQMDQNKDSGSLNYVGKDFSLQVVTNTNKNSHAMKIGETSISAGCGYAGKSKFIVVNFWQTTKTSESEFSSSQLSSLYIPVEFNLSKTSESLAIPYSQDIAFNLNPSENQNIVMKPTAVEQPYKVQIVRTGDLIKLDMDCDGALFTDFNNGVSKDVNSDLTISTTCTPTVTDN